MTEKRAPVVAVANNEARSRYEISLDGVRVGLADYKPGPPGVVVMPHTEIDPDHGGRGLAGQLIKFALDDIAASGRKVKADCPFVAAYLTKHPEYSYLQI
jgi:predicted GNAT family acetyltransferase